MFNSQAVLYLGTTGYEFYQVAVRHRFACRFQARRLPVLMGVGRQTLERLFQQKLGVSPQRWLNLERMVLAQHYMRYPGSRVKEVAKVLCYRSSEHFSRSFRKCYGESPKHFRDRRSLLIGAKDHAFQLLIRR